MASDTPADILEPLADPDYRKRRLECLYIGSWLEETIENMALGAKIKADNAGDGLFGRRRHLSGNSMHADLLIVNTIDGFEREVAIAGPQCGLPPLSKVDNNGVFTYPNSEVAKAWNDFKNSTSPETVLPLFEEFRKQWRIARNEGLPEE